MPIREDLKFLYGETWRKKIRPAILERAENRCEGSPAYPDCWAENRKPHPVTGSKVVLTIAHMDHVSGNDEAENLKALCQRCHLKHDEKQHAENAAETRLLKLIRKGQETFVRKSEQIRF